MFLQKWENEEEKAQAGDYRIFFATNQKPGKDNSGEYVWLDKETGERARKTNGEIARAVVLVHDLTEIAEAFKAFAKEEGLNFFA